MISQHHVLKIRFMNLVVSILTGIFILVFGQSTYAIELSTLEDSFSVVPKHYTNPLPKAKDTNYLISLRGQSSEELYNLVEADIKIDPCIEAKSKTVGETRCYNFENQRGYECDFSIDVENQNIEYGHVC